jgi:hypothetical protein
MKSLIAISLAWMTSVAAAPAGNTVTQKDMRAEVKVRVRAKSADEFRNALGLKKSSASKIRVLFYDTPTQDLYRRLHGVVRAREDGSQVDVTVKFRPVELARVSRKWLGQSGFKCEMNVYVHKEVPSCSIKAQEPGDERKNFTVKAKLRTFFEEYAGESWNPKQLVTYGPATMDKWELSDWAGLDRVHVEIWRFPDGHEFYEVSGKVELQKRHKYLERLIEHIQGLGLRVESKPISRMEYLFSKAS